MPEEDGTEVAAEDAPLEEAGVEGGDEGSAPEEIQADEAPAETFTVDGEEVTLDDLTSGYMKNADYTQKTQELASEREKYAAFEQLEQAFEDDPEGTAQRLVEAYGYTVTDGTSTPTEVGGDDDIDLDSMTDLEKEVHELRQAEARRQRSDAEAQEAALQAQITADLDAVRSKHGDYDEDKLIQFALDTRTADFEVALLAMRAKEAESEPKPSAKQKATPVEGGSSRNGASDGASSNMDLDEAIAFAVKEHG